MNITATLIVQLISFCLFVLFTKVIVWPHISAAMERRKKTIADGLAAAEQGEKAQEIAQQEAKKLIDAAREQAADIVASAQKRSNDIVEQAKSTAISEGARLKASAQEEIESEKLKAKQALKNEVVQIALLGAEKVLEREIDSKSHQTMLEKFAAEL